MPKKKQKSSPSAPAAHACHAPGCKAPGEYRAPKSKNNLRDYDWYCLDHIRDYNRKWDYFDGMSSEEIEAFMRDAVTGHRPTWSRESQVKEQYDRLREAIEEFMRQSAKARKTSAALHPKLREALAVMDIEHPYTLAQLKTRYRALVKKFHPDVNRGDALTEEKFKAIAVSYLLLMRYLKEDCQ